ncbi:fas-binding factor 1 homolog [Salarias fasciatus]|uniref:fas-binding factor 1 homolog n=1 Tax=Salarias fasciatus TaxID=181472 RepID=UPI00117699FA|nr:fas-binding factor 1 [Salarias fasciatus]
MATKARGKTSKSSLIDEDILDSLFDDKNVPVRGNTTRSGQLNRSSATNNIFSMLAEEVKRDGADTEDSDVSVADPNDLLKNMKDMDDMDADLFASKKKPSLAPAQTKLLGNEGPKKDAAVLDSTHAKPEGEDEPARVGKKPNSASSSTVRNYKKFTFSDFDDPLDDLLPDETTPEPKNKRPEPEKSAPSPSPSPILNREANKAAKKDEFMFEDDKDDLMDALGFDSEKNNPKKKEAPLWSSKERSDAPQRARTRIDEILEGFSSPNPLEQPPTGERKEQLHGQERQQQEKTVKEPLLEDDLTFGSYQPTMVSTPEGRQSRRQSVRFSTEDVSLPSPEKKAKPANHAPIRHRNSSDWLGLKTDDEPSYDEDGRKEKKTPAESPKTPSSPLLERKPSFTAAAETAGDAAPTRATANQTNPDVSRIQTKDDEGDDWLAGALSRRKALSASNREVKLSTLEESRTDLELPARHQVTSQTPRSKEDTFLTAKETSNDIFGESNPAAHSTPLSETRTKREHPAQVTAVSISDPEPRLQARPSYFPSSDGSRSLREPSRPDETEQPPSTVLPGTVRFPKQSQTPSTPAAVQQQATFSTESLQQQLLLQQMMQTQLLGLGGVVDTGVLQRLKDKDQQTSDYQALQARIIQLEGQVKTLQLEKEQSQLMLENVQQRHKQDMELMENTHKTRVKLLEESASQRETRARLECEDLMERLSAATRSAEQERSELQAQYQRKLAQAQQDRDREVERLRDLQRKSILEMKKDHEDQIQRLKKLKEEEIDAVTSATSQTRSLAGVIEQMEQFSSQLGELSSRVESTHEHTAHGLEQGARHRDEQLRTMQDRLAQQQKAMADERAYLKEIISRMDTQLSEQQRQLEKERWKMTAEQAKAESTQRGLEEERRVFSMQIGMEREELERAKSALLEEQKSVMQHCADERRKLAAEWAHFHAQEKQRRERAEREASSLMERREDSIISLAQEQADLKLRTAELKQKELSVAQERDTLDRLREELDREKERISSTALRLKTRAQEVEAFSKLAAEKYEEGERAMQKAKCVEAEHEARLRSIHSQTEQLRQQEQRVLKERMRFSLVQNTGLLRENPSIPPILPESVSVLPNPGLAATVNLPSPNSQAMALQASLALWKYTTEKDREFLEEEQIFLDNLKKKSYKSLLNTD